ncbi:hypothetical protein [Mycoplasma crocodyli]|uniref:Lipoprotein n=1 Tax=Mycoplasma crocodyli (strain ATCC 51981 / MP145) TaxID=512564 RepID=D5E6D2_MYCCM|nr:hypothetical protein [Mycoplasma crocodyli]ADE19925.1 lipoprotein [Mycoplasma crocodyli MP145]
MKTKKIIALGLGGVSVLAVGLSAACGPKKDNPDNKEEKFKEIVIAVDGPQKEMYDYVIEQFNATDFAKKGYKIKTINKDVWGAMDFGPAGFTDRDIVPDIFYGAQDRVTTFAQSNAVAELNEFDPTLFDKILAVTGATNEEKEAAKEFGSVVGVNEGDKTFKPVKKLLAIRHNTEAIILVSTNELSKVKADLADAKTNTLEGLTKEAKLFARIQDFWYGNGALNAALNDITKTKSLKDPLISKILYTKAGGALASGFVTTDEHHADFKEGIKEAAKLYYPIYEAAYLKSETEFKNTEWGKKGITQGSLKNLLQGDMGAVNNEVFSLMKNKKLEYGIIGTWDIQNAQKSADAKTFVNIGEISKGRPYKQASGSWSYMINARNNGSSKERKDAIKEVLKLIFSSEAYYKYFKLDSKVPYYLASQVKVKELQAKVSTLPKQALDKLIKDTGFTTTEEFNKAYNEQVGKIEAALKYEVNSWSVDKDPKNALDAKNELEAYVLKKESFTELKDAEKEIADFNKNFGKTTGLRNAIAAILGVDLNQLLGNNEPWQIGLGILKDGLKFVEEAKTDAEKILAETKQSDTSLHIRKMEKYIFGANGDSDSDKDNLLDEIIKNFKENKLDAFKKAMVDKAILVNKELAKTVQPKETIEKAVELYFNYYKTKALLKSFGNDYQKSAKFTKKDNTKSEYTLMGSADIVKDYEKSLAVDKVLNVLTSTKSIQDGGLGVPNFGGRLDNSNPHFGNVAWGSWNESTFGNKTFLEEKSKTVKTFDDFVNVIETQLSTLYKQKIDAITATSGSGLIIFAK